MDVERRPHAEASSPSPPPAAVSRRASAARRPCCPSAASHARSTSSRAYVESYVFTHHHEPSSQLPSSIGPVGERRRDVVVRRRVDAHVRRPPSSTNVLNVDPGWRRACESRLNWLLLRPGITAAIARIAPVAGSIETIAAAGSVRSFSTFADRLLGKSLVARDDGRVHLADRPTAPSRRRTRRSAGRGRSRRSTARGSVV